MNTQSFLPARRNLYKKQRVLHAAEFFRHEGKGDDTEGRDDMNRLQRACLNRAVAACDKPRQKHAFIPKVVRSSDKRRFNNE